MTLVLMAWCIDKLTNQLVIQTIHAKIIGMLEHVATRIEIIMKYKNIKKHTILTPICRG